MNPGQRITAALVGLLILVVAVWVGERLSDGGDGGSDGSLRSLVSVPAGPDRQRHSPGPWTPP